MATLTLSSFVEWVAAMDAARTGNPLWSVQAYRLASYAIECHTFDRRTNRPLSKAITVDQLTQAVGSIAANIAEGYSRPSPADQNRFYGYALGSAREAIAWYDILRIELGALADDRQATLIQIRRLLLTTLRNSRSNDALAAMSKSAGRTPREEC
jgi:four helix bundle protein